MNSDQAKRKVVEQFGRNAEKYVTSQAHAKGADLDLIVEWTAPEESWVVLDIATGGGYTAKALAPYVYQVFATDLTKEMLSNTSLHLKAYSHIFYVLADAETVERKKRYPFQEWVKRTTKSLNEEKRVIEYMLDANKKIKQYYRLKMKEDKIESIEVDDWNVLFRKE
ncbi:class I SAM-dependent methyltransferase [Bacillus zhangzhouensis]|uniref:Methyltransferase domain-containing protein n=1 Tax=Bacillus zhangzhouensis TaxID=1178540 RepID=A0A081L705_9BACI|nr:methyltransferase domain-containing protein [Bacillus zhangzhouensis]KEP25031.1 hypothetical protein BA70_12295 [Bacillus zhangzhouensis]